MDVMYKIFPTILTNKLNPSAEEIGGEMSVWF